MRVCYSAISNQRLPPGAMLLLLGVRAQGGRGDGECAHSSASHQLYPCMTHERHHQWEHSAMIGYIAWRRGVPTCLAQRDT